MKIVIDLSNLAYICLYGYQARNGKDSYNREEFLKICNAKIFAIKATTKATTIYFAKDNYPRRKDLDNKYKSNRIPCKFPIKQDLITLLQSRNVKIFEATDTEADDVMAWLLKNNKVDCIVSTDQDLLQAIDNGNQLFNPVTMEFWNRKKLQKKYQLNKYKDILWYKSFFGDSSDCIPKVGDRIPRKIVANIINERKFHNWKQLFKQLQKFPKVWNKIDTSRLKLNYKLVKLNKNIKVKKVK